MLVRFDNIFVKIIFIIFLLGINNIAHSEENNVKLIKTDWSFNGVFGTFDRASLQRGYQVYQEVCSGCHSVQHLSYRNLYEEGGPEFTLDEAKAIAPPEPPSPIIIDKFGTANDMQHSIEFAIAEACPLCSAPNPG